MNRAHTQLDFTVADQEGCVVNKELQYRERFTPHLKVRTTASTVGKSERASERSASSSK